MILSHLYARKAEAQVFSSPGMDGHLVTVLHQGNWMGVVEDKGDWIHVVTIDGEGWVRSEDAEARTPVGLHIRLSEGLNIEYVNQEGEL